MKQQGPDTTNRSNRNRRLWFPGILIPVILFALSCQNDIEYINKLSSELNMPVLTAKDFEVQFTDSGRMQVRFIAALVERYDNNTEEGEYYEFTEGLNIEFYNKEGEIESTITANYGKYFEEKNLGYASDNVIGTNLLSHDTLRTEELFWDQEKQELYSNVFSRISNEEGVYYGEEGFVSDQKFENYKLLGSSGTVNVEDEELQ